MTRSTSNPSRRLFLKQSAAMSALGAGAPLALNLAAMGSVAAQSAGDYKALVCVFMSGGNDAYSTVLPTDSTSWNLYSKARNQQPSSIALPLSAVLALSPAQSLADGRTVALHPQLKSVQAMFNSQRKLSVISSVGPLIEPLTKDDYSRQSKRAPSKLFSHNDQQSTWQALGPEGSPYGWGGRLADAVSSGNGNSLFTGISAAGNAVWVSGQTVKQYQMQSTGMLRYATSTGTNGTDQLFESDVLAAALNRVATTPRTAHRLEADIAQVSKRSIDAEKLLRNALPSAANAPYGPDSLLLYTKTDGSRAVNPLAQQLQIVARSIGARNTLGMKRQVFFVSLGGFDTHDDQISRHANLMAQLDHALSYFDSALTSLGVSNDVTTFTASDFGRTLTSNGDGTDHGWGGHHFVMGGAVDGGNVLGSLPTYALKNVNNNNFDGSPDLLTNGALLPKVSVDQYGAALGRWFGVSDSNLSTVFPNLRNFSGSLGLMRA